MVTATCIDTCRPRHVKGLKEEVVESQWPRFYSTLLLHQLFSVNVALQMKHRAKQEIFCRHIPSLRCLGIKLTHSYKVQNLCFKNLHNVQKNLHMTASNTDQSTYHLATFWDSANIFPLFHCSSGWPSSPYSDISSLGCFFSFRSSKA